MEFGTDSKRVSVQPWTLELTLRVEVNQPRKLLYTLKIGMIAPRSLLVRFKLAQDKGLVSWQTISNAIILYESTPADCSFNVV